jgi:phosphoheptose isomerase
MRYRVTGFDQSGRQVFSRVVEAIAPELAKIIALAELRRSIAVTHLADQAVLIEVETEPRR